MSEISSLKAAEYTKKRRLFESFDDQKRLRSYQAPSSDRREKQVSPEPVHPTPTSPVPSSSSSPNRREKQDSPEHVHPTLPNSARCLACPYYKHNPQQHRQCAHANLSKISYVKQHLLRKHLPPIHCLRCYETFGKNAAFEEHLRQSVPCEVRPKRDLPGMTSEQIHKLKTRSNPAQDETAQWEAIWKMLFPQTPPPSSVYIDLDLPEEVNELREHIARNIPPRIVKVLGLEENEELSRKLIEMILEVADQWIGRRRDSQASAVRCSGSTPVDMLD